MTRLLLALLTVCLLTIGIAPAHAADPGAPPGAPPDWLPSDEWVMERWMPYDVRTLEGELLLPPGSLPRFIGDHAPLARMARRRGLSASGLARSVIRPWRGVADARQMRVLERRAQLTFTQPHLMVHMLTHAYHLASLNAALLPMLRLDSWATFGRLRGKGLTLVQMGRRGGRSRTYLHGRAAEVLRANERRGIALKATPRAQAAATLKFQLTYLDGWLNE